MKRLIAIVVLALGALVSAQSPPAQSAGTLVDLPSIEAVALVTMPADGKTPPKLTDIGRLKVVNAAQSVELWQLKVQAAAQEYGKAKDALDKLVTSLQVPGFDLTNDLVYVPKVKKESK